MSLKQTFQAYHSLELTPALNDEAMHEFQRGLPGPIPSEVEELLRYASGFFSASLGIIDFTGSIHRLEFIEIIPKGIPLAKTEYGNFWVVDVKEDK